ncbi:diaminopropionate ammonia-lyase [Comamonas granuli]|uniref:diaminopropionate ammonia-lyase n=1 Tax=Comamonas granuli TaxID=290309 RepID=UPI0005A88D25|nr:diaminopropionate ammonia-lyase [Comamonas granuli]
MSAIPAIAVDVFLNPALDRSAAYGAARSAILGQEALSAARADIQTWPGYAVTPLHSLPGMARDVGVASIQYKDEGGRFGLGSFKALGGAYAVARLLCRVIGEQTGQAVTTQQLLAGAHRDLAQQVTVTCATDGNHGRSVAWGAQLFGCRCVIYIHATVSEGRRQAIEHYGAQVVRTAGNYDDAVRQADADAKALGRYVISDTSYEGYMDVPRDVMQGYQLMVEEAVQQAGAMPTHVFIQGGVGGLAAAVCGYFWERLGSARPRVIVVEPERADCLMQSARSGKITAVHGDLDTLMAGLACGEVSLLAWSILEAGADAFAVIADQAAIDTMRLLAAPAAGDPAIVAGESAVAGLAAALGVAQNAGQRAALGIDGDSRLMFFGSERDTDPVLYRELVGRSAAEVLAAAGARA